MGRYILVWTDITKLHYDLHNATDSPSVTVTIGIITVKQNNHDSVAYGKRKPPAYGGNAAKYCYAILQFPPSPEPRDPTWPRVGPGLAHHCNGVGWKADDRSFPQKLNVLKLAAGRLATSSRRLATSSRCR